MVDVVAVERLFFGRELRGLFEQPRGQTQLADILQQPKRTEHHQLLARILQKASEHGHHDRHFDRAVEHTAALFLHLGEQRNRVRIALHAFGDLGRGLASTRTVDRATLLSHRSTDFGDDGRGAPEGARGTRQLNLDARRRLVDHVSPDFYRGLDARRRGRRRWRLPRRLRAPVVLFRIDEHRFAELLQRLELLFRAQHEALEHERGVGPRAVELRHIHPEAQLSNGDFPEVHGR